MKVSIVMSAYNAEQYIKEAIMSCVNQTHKDIELIVVEDKSTDSTLQIIHQLQDTYHFITIEHELNEGAGKSRYDGIKAATGDYIITIDSDDTIDETFIEMLVTKALQTEADIVSGGITILNKDDDYTETKLFGNRISEGLQKFIDYNNGKIIFLNNKLIKKSLYDKVDYCIRRYCEDTPVIMKLLYYANKVAYAQTVGYNYLQHSNSLCHTVDKFEDSLYKALCGIECIQFFGDKEQEYTDLITLQQIKQYLEVMKMNMTQEHFDKYKPELAECMVFVLTYIV